MDEMKIISSYMKKCDVFHHAKRLQYLPLISKNVLDLFIVMSSLPMPKEDCIEPIIILCYFLFHRSASDYKIDRPPRWENKTNW